MIWLIIFIVIIAIFVFSKYSYDSKYVKNKNISIGGMVKLFPEFVSYFEKNEFELVNDSGTNLVYKIVLTNNQMSNKFLFLGLESKFSNIIYGYIVTQDNKKIKSANVPFSKNYKPEDVEIIIRMITDEFHVLGHLTQFSKLNKSDNKVKDPTKLNKLLIELVEEADNIGNSEMDNIDKISTSLYERNIQAERKENIDLIKVYTKEIEEYPNNKDLYYSRANKKLFLDDYSGAIEDFKKIIELDPDDLDAIEFLNDAIESQKFEEESNIILKEIADSVIDVDGNIYKTVQIGNQVWLKENLRVSKFRNGDLIPNIKVNKEWENTQSGAWCNYDNKFVYDSEYGKLYNWFAVDDNRGLAPEGWHIARNDEWADLLDYLGGINIAGGKLKEVGTTHWNEPNKGATNESVFGGLPGGGRYEDNAFNNIGKNAYWWSVTGIGGYNAWNWVLSNDDTEVNCFGGYSKQDGFSVRCLRDI